MTLLTQQAIASGNVRRINNRIKQLESRLDRLVEQGENPLNSEAVRRIYLADAEEASSDMSQLEAVLERGSLQLQHEQAKLNKLLEALV